MSEVHRWRAFAVLAVSFFMTIVDLTIVNVALPTIGAKLHFSESNLQWVVTAYGVSFGGFLLLGGRAADLLGRRRVLLVGLSVFTAASLACGLATTDSFLIAMRGVQGLGAAIVLPAALSIVMNMFEEGAERNKALGIWGGIGAAGATFGLIAGGLLTRYVGWEYIFVLNVPIGAAALLLAPRLVPESKLDAARRRYDPFGALTVTGGLLLLVYSISRAPQVGWSAASTVLLLASSALSLVAFLVIEVEQLNQPRAVVDQSVDRREQRRAAAEGRVVEVDRVNPPLAFDALDNGWFAHLADVHWFDWRFGSACPRDAERAQAQLISGATRLAGGHDRIVGIDPFSEVPQPLAGSSSGDRNLAARHHKLEQLADVAVVGPAGRLPRHRTSVWQLASRRRAVGRKPAQDVTATAVVGQHPLVTRLSPARQIVAAIPLVHIGSVERNVLARSDDAPQLDQLAVLNQHPQLIGLVGAAEATPQHQVSTRGHGGGRLDVKQRQPTDDLEQVGRLRAVEQLRADGDPSGVGAGKLVHRALSTRRIAAGYRGSTKVAFGASCASPSSIVASCDRGCRRTSATR